MFQLHLADNDLGYTPNAPVWVGLPEIANHLRLESLNSIRISPILISPAGSKDLSTS